MIFVTIGSMFPFDRLIRLMDDWTAAQAAQSGAHPVEILAQIGEGKYEPKHMRFVRRLSQSDFAATVQGCRLVVAHAGMGSMITAGQYGKPIVMLPRLQEWGEHTTDHQIATANWLRSKPGVYIADRDEDLGPQIDRALHAGAALPTLAQSAPPEFLTRIRTAILG